MIRTMSTTASTAFPCIAGYALNNTATNVYLMMMNYATFYLMGWVGVGMMVASSLTMMMRIWDGVTDPFVGFMVDKTNGKFGKNRPATSLSMSPTSCLRACASPSMWSF